MKGNEQIQKQQQRQTPTPQLYIYSICTVYAQILCWYTVTTNVYFDTVWLADGHWAGRDLSLHGKGSAAFQHGWTLTIKLRVTVHQRWDSNQNLLSVPLHHQLQLPTRLLYQLPCITQRKVLRHCAVNLGERTQARSEHGKILLHVDSRTVQFLMGKVETGSIGVIEP